MIDFAAAGRINVKVDRDTITVGFIAFDADIRAVLDGLTAAGRLTVTRFPYLFKFGRCEISVAPGPYPFETEVGIFETPLGMAAFQ